jgi:hypothetical protein
MEVVLSITSTSFKILLKIHIIENNFSGSFLLRMLCVVKCAMGITVLQEFVNRDCCNICSLVVPVGLKAQTL